MFNFKLLPHHSSQYGRDVAKVIIKAIEKVKFSGRCEYYAADAFMYGMLNTYLFGLGLKPKKKAFNLTYSWWLKFVQVISDILSEIDIGIELDDLFSEMGSMGEIRATHLFRGAVEFSDGIPIMIINKAQADSGFTSEILEIIE